MNFDTKNKWLESRRPTPKFSPDPDPRTLYPMYEGTHTHVHIYKDSKTV